MASSDRIINAGLRLVRGLVRDQLRRRTQRSEQRSHATFRRPSQAPRPDVRDEVSAHDYPGDFTGRPTISYAPFHDEQPDPGEIVWTWVPYEEDHSQGKDRPVLIIGRDGPWLLALQMTSQDHDRDAAQEASQGRYWEDIGSGDWDRDGRPSEVRVNRLIRVAPQEVRRIGAVLGEDRFNRVARAVLEHS